MRPALSVIVFTVLSGAGLGLANALLVLDFIEQFSILPMGRAIYAEALLSALVLVLIGLGSSTLHLASPAKARRALSQWRTSWLSREGVTAVLFLALATALLLLLWFDPPGLGASLQPGLGLATMVSAWLVLFSTGMIYACLRTVPMWNTPLVPLGYLAMGHASGALLLLWWLPQAPLAQLHAWAWLVLAALLKGLHWLRFPVFDPAPGASVTAAGTATATGTGRGPGIAEAIPTAAAVTSAAPATRSRIRLLDAGHTHGNFLTHEFMFRIGRSFARSLRLAVWLLAFLLPALMLSSPQWRWLAGLPCVAGLLLERWLFFAEARHVVRLFYGEQRI